MHIGSKTKLLVATAVFAVSVCAYVKFGDLLTLDSLAKQEELFRSYRSEHPFFTYVIAFAIYVGVTGLSIPGASALTLLCGWCFGFVRAALVVSFASTAGASVAFLLSRYFFRDWIQKRFGERLQQFNESLIREGAFYLFTLRLIPVVPFFVINAVMGLTPMKLPTFWWVSQLGMLPATLIYVYAGSSVPSLAKLSEQGYGELMNWQLMVAFALLGVFPLIARRWHNRVMATRLNFEETR